MPSRFRGLVGSPPSLQDFDPCLLGQAGPVGAALSGFASMQPPTVRERRSQIPNNHLGDPGVVLRTLFLHIFDSAPVSRWELFLSHSTTQTHTHTHTYYTFFFKIHRALVRAFLERSRGEGIQPLVVKKGCGDPASGRQSKRVPAGHAELPLHPWQIYATSSQGDLDERLDRNPPPSRGMRGWNAIGLGQAPFPNPSIHPFDHQQTAGHRAGRSSR